MSRSTLAAGVLAWGLLAAGGCGVRRQEGGGGSGVGGGGGGFELREGEYVLRARVKTYSRGELESDEEQADAVRLTRQGDGVTITHAERDTDPIVGSLKGDEFEAEAPDGGDAGEDTKLVGRLVSDDCLEGSLTAKSADGEETLEGTWTLEPAAE